MALKTGDDYLASIEALDLHANVLGSGAQSTAGHPLVRPSLRAVAVTYDCAHDPEVRDLFRAHSSLTGGEVNRFTHLHRSADDLVKKVLMQRHCGNLTGCCFQRCVGMDAANAVYSVTYECDAAHGTDYHRRFCDYWAWVQRGDLVVDGAMTDPKGDRSKRPSEQADPDLYLRVMERRPDGVVVRGAKFHQTGLLTSHEILVMPTAALRPGEEAWATCFALPTDSPGLRYLLGRQAGDTRKMEEGLPDVGNPLFGGQEVLVVFDDVFVPAERVFLDGEVDQSGALVERFAAYHRQSYGGCKVGVGDVLIGATALAARMNGVDGASHVRDKLVEMIHLNETMFACGIACSARGAGHGRRQLPGGPAPGQRLQAERHPLPVRDGAPGDGYCRRAAGHAALGQGAGRPRAGSLRTQISGRRRRLGPGRPGQGPAPHREPGGRRRGRGLSYRVDARCRLAHGPTHRHWPPGGPGGQGVAGPPAAEYIIVIMREGEQVW